MAKKERVKGEPWSDETLYEQLSELKTKQEAEESLAKFIAGIEKLRKDCKIPDVVIGCTVHVKDDKGERIAAPVQLLALGNSDVSTELGSIIFRKYTLPTIKRGEALRVSAVGEPSEND